MSAPLNGLNNHQLNGLDALQQIQSSPASVTVTPGQGLPTPNNVANQMQASKGERAAEILKKVGKGFGGALLATTLFAVTMATLPIAYVFIAGFLSVYPGKFTIAKDENDKPIRVDNFGLASAAEQLYLKGFDDIFKHCFGVVNEEDAAKSKPAFQITENQPGAMPGNVVIQENKKKEKANEALEIQDPTQPAVNPAAQKPLKAVKEKDANEILAEQIAETTKKIAAAKLAKKEGLIDINIPPNVKVDENVNK